MTIKDEATFVASGAHFYTAPVGTPKPTDPLNPGTPWEELGHTDLSEVSTLESEGGDKTILGTMQNRALRSVTAPKTYSWGVKVKQFDTGSLRSYFGSNATVNSDGTVTPSDSPTPTRSAFYAVLADGTVNAAFVFYAGLAEISAGDNIEFSGEDLSTLPLNIGVLTAPGAKGPFDCGLVNTLTGQPIVGVEPTTETPAEPSAN